MLTKTLAEKALLLRFCIDTGNVANEHKESRHISTLLKVLRII